MRSKLLDFIDNKARLNFVSLLDYLKTERVEDFVRYARHPFLMGKELYEGKLEEDQYRSSNTMPFHKSDIQALLRPNAITAEGSEPAESKGTGISKAVFMLVKRRGSPGLANEIFIGRSQESDLVIADYAVSKIHAKLIINKGRYSIVDEGSTNGTFFNDHPLKPGVEYELPPDNDIAFGRLVFRFISPNQLYYLLSA
ncbi:hypothetical protein BVY04_05175 [bacterium M21]|nr:hypothetical protein BVY04_05175 [bacterium M21]